jgi:hypothetical protein
MAENAYQTVYRQEFIAGFEQRQSLLRASVTTVADIKGNQAVFLVADSGGATAVTRGSNGKIPARGDNLSQPVVTLKEKHDLVQKTRYNITTGQGDQRRVMQESSMTVINRDIDAEILAELASATITTGAATVGSLANVARVRAIMAANKVDTQEIDNMFAVVPAGYMSGLLQVPAFTSSDYVDIKPLAGPVRKFLRWAGFNWIEHPMLSLNTNQEFAYFYHRSAIGHAADTAGINTDVGYKGEQDYSYARASLFHGAKLLQNTGVVKVAVDSSAYAAV